MLLQATESQYDDVEKIKTKLFFITFLLRPNNKYQELTLMLHSCIAFLFFYLTVHYLFNVIIFFGTLVAILRLIYIKI